MSRNFLLHAALVFALYVLHLTLPDYHHGQVARIMVLAVYAMGYNILFGYSGLLSLGHAMFFAAGMYGMGLSAQHLDMATLPAFAIGILSATVLAFIVGLLALRTIGVGFMIVTLMFAQAGYLTILYFGEYTRGDEGFVLVTTARKFMSLDFSQADTRYLAALVLFGIALFIKAGTTLGPIIGTAFMVYLIDYASGLTDAYMLLVGVTLVLITLFVRGGILGFVRAKLVPWLP